MSKLHLVGKLSALVLPAMISPMSIFFVRQFMKTIPKSYEEAAFIDGASRLTVFIRLILPMSKSVIIMTTLLCFLGSWNNFMGPLIYLSDWDKMTLPIGLRTLNGYMGSGSVSVIFAGVTLSLIVPTLLYIFGQKYILQGVVLSGLKS
jgi:multiple sugar transport system permease protein